MGDAPRLTDDGLEIVRVRAELGQRNIHPKDIASIARELMERRAQQSEGAQAKVVIQREVIHYRDLIEKGKGTHGQPGYVRDDTWNYWQGRLSMAEELLRAVAPPHRQTEEKR